MTPRGRARCEGSLATRSRRFHADDGVPTCPRPLSRHHFAMPPAPDVSSSGATCARLSSTCPVDAKDFESCHRHSRAACLDGPEREVASTCEHADLSDWEQTIDGSVPAECANVRTQDAPASLVRVPPYLSLPAICPSCRLSARVSVSVCLCCHNTCRFQHHICASYSVKNARAGMDMRATIRFWGARSISGCKLTTTPSASFPCSARLRGKSHSTPARSWILVCDLSTANSLRWL